MVKYEQTKRGKRRGDKEKIEKSKGEEDKTVYSFHYLDYENMSISKRLSISCETSYALAQYG